jgi:DNA-binding LacI/PurR family transcriptional regulator
MSDPTSPANLEDVARRAGVSLATASRVLRGNVRVSEELRAKVQAAVVELNYQPNPMVASLMRQVRARRVPAYHGVIAYVATHPEQGFWDRDRVGWAFRAGAEEEAKRSGYELQFFLPRVTGLSPAQLTRQLLARGVAGAVLHGSRVTTDHTRTETWMTASSLPVVLVGQKEERPTMNFAMADQFANARLVATQISALGYRRPLLVSTDYLHLISEGRFEKGFESGCEVGGIKPSICRMPSGIVMKVEGEAEFRRAMKRHRPDAVVSLVDRTWSWIMAAGLRVPAELGYATMDLPDTAVPQWAGIDQKHRLVGAQAAAQLVEQIERGETGAAPVVHGRLVEGQWRSGPTLVQR